MKDGIGNVIVNSEERYTQGELDNFLNKRKKEKEDEFSKIRIANRASISEVLNKHLQDNVVILSSSELEKTNGPSINSAETVTLKKIKAVLNLYLKHRT